MKKQTDDLVKRAKRHESEAFTELMQLYMTDMYKVAYAILMNDEDAAGSHGSKQHSGMSGASCNFVQSVGRAYAELKAVVRVYRSLFCLSVEKERFGYGS